MKIDHKWLESWSESLDGNTVLELGCGSGIDTPLIANYAASVVACDLSPPESILGASKIMKLDHSQKLPFKDCSFNVVVASLCLHYFQWSTTIGIVTEIFRILSASGILLCRLNSERDTNYGASGYPEIDTRLFNVDGQSKRFFSKADIHALFPSPWIISGLKEKTIDRYEKEKVVWEFSVQSNKCKTKGLR